MQSLSIKLKHMGLILLFSLSMTGCIKHTSLVAEQRPASWAKLINKEHNLYQVNTQLYRGEQPIRAQSDTLKALQIDTIISLRSRNTSQEQLADLGFKVVHIPINTWQINRQDVLNSMQAIRKAQQNNSKILIHCYHGSDRTGTMVAMYRIFFEHWSVAEAKREMKLGGYGFHPIWINIDPLFSPENIQWIETQLNPSS